MDAASCLPRRAKNYTKRFSLLLTGFGQSQATGLWCTLNVALLKKSDLLALSMTVVQLPSKILLEKASPFHMSSVGSFPDGLVE